MFVRLIGALDTHGVDTRRIPWRSYDGLEFGITYRVIDTVTLSSGTTFYKLLGKSTLYDSDRFEPIEEIESKWIIGAKYVNAITSGPKPTLSLVHIHKGYLTFENMNTGNVYSILPNFSLNYQMVEPPTLQYDPNQQGDMDDDI